MEVSGKIKLINEAQTFGQNGFRKRELVITTNEQYPQSIMIEFVQDKCDLLNNFNIGQDVTVSINLRGREWVNPEGLTKYFNSIQGWRINVSQATDSQTDTAPVDNLKTVPAADLSSNEADDLPF